MDYLKQAHDVKIRIKLIKIINRLFLFSFFMIDKCMID